MTTSPWRAGDPVLRVSGLGVRYGALIALQDIDWEVRSGEILGIIGPNGAGKSSCFEAVTHSVRRQGRVFLMGREITALPPHALSELGLKRAFQQNAFFGQLTVIENMQAAISRSHGTGLVRSFLMPLLEARQRRHCTAQARSILERFSVPAAYHDLLPDLVPYGIQRMLSIALGYGTGARAILLDEPAAGLGGPDMARLSEIILELKREGVAVVLVEHHMDLVMSVVDRVVVIDQGKAIATGTPAQIQKDERVLEAYLGRTE